MQVNNQSADISGNASEMPKYVGKAWGVRLYSLIMLGALFEDTANNETYFSHRLISLIFCQAIVVMVWKKFSMTHVRRNRVARSVGYCLFAIGSMFFWMPWDEYANLTHAFLSFSLNALVGVVILAFSFLLVFGRTWASKDVGTESATAADETGDFKVICPNPACGHRLAVPSATVEAVPEESAQSDDIEFPCPFCRHQLAVDKSGAGLVVACPECGEQIVIPVHAARVEPAQAVLSRDLSEGLSAEAEHDCEQESRNYFYADERKLPVGPYAAARMRQLYRQGILDESSWVVEEGLTEWQSYASVFLPKPAIPLAPRNDQEDAHSAGAQHVYPLPATPSVSCPKCYKADVQRPYSWKTFSACLYLLILCSLYLPIRQKTLSSRDGKSVFGRSLALTPGCL